MAILYDNVMDSKTCDLPTFSVSILFTYNEAIPEYREALANAFPRGPPFTRVPVLRQIEMAHKVLGKDMQELVTSLKQAQRYSTTTLDEEYRK